ncbi:MAG: hypothetical protein ACRD2A_16005 [Vicinamibacterales bacterium]
MARDDILKTLDAEFDAFLNTLEGLSDEQMTAAFERWLCLP